MKIVKVLWSVVDHNVVSLVLFVALIMFMATACKREGATTIPEPALNSFSQSGKVFPSKPLSIWDKK